jgi:hypothetical protein
MGSLTVFERPHNAAQIRSPEVNRREETFARFIRCAIFTPWVVACHSKAEGCRGSEYRCWQRILGKILCFERSKYNVGLPLNAVTLFQHKTT